ncbi:MAG: tRNA pseudouridine(38-40) synthase TruA [Flavobacteriaceae bacterium]|nr:MAG: tRNA pseudouridine(38-40) synthase TruA [Flavobacteriaceae bacterium]
MRYFLELSYNGKNYHGWQIQPNDISVQQVVQESLSTVLRAPIEIVAAGRTDAGVHASQIFVHMDLDNELDENDMLYKLNSLFPSDIAVRKIIRVKEDAHARFNATFRSYEYKISLEKNPFTMDYSWQVTNKQFDIEKMNQAASLLLNYENFKCFSRSKTDVKTYNCDITRAEWKRKDNELVFYISADRFLRNMVRAIVGTLLEIGNGKMTIDQFKDVIQSRDRRNAGPSVPACGLFLTQVGYPLAIYDYE